MKMATILTLAVCLLLPLTATTAYARDSGATSAARSPNNLKVNSSAQAVQLVKRQYQGKVLKAQSAKTNGQSGYRVKMISREGRVFYVFVDAQSGSISGK